MSAMVDMSWANDHIIPNPELFNHFFLEIPNRSRWVLLAQTFFGERASLAEFLTTNQGGYPP